MFPFLGYKEPFSWRKYLSETSTIAVPSIAFKPPKSEVSLFRKGMKLEAVDKRNPSIIRVATVVDIIRHDICVISILFYDLNAIFFKQILIYCFKLFLDSF
jgi:hypothetical protein